MTWLISPVVLVCILMCLWGLTYTGSWRALTLRDCLRAPCCKVWCSGIYLLVRAHPPSKTSCISFQRLNLTDMVELRAPLPLDEIRATFMSTQWEIPPLTSMCHINFTHPPIPGRGGVDNRIKPKSTAWYIIMDLRPQMSGWAGAL